MLTRAQPQVGGFVFGTRLTRLTPWLRGRNPDLAVSRTMVGQHDWVGGARIAKSPREFNRRRERRALGSSAAVVRASDWPRHGDAAARERDVVGA